MTPMPPRFSSSRISKPASTRPGTRSNGEPCPADGLPCPVSDETATVLWPALLQTGQISRKSAGSEPWMDKSQLWPQEHFRRRMVMGSTKLMKGKELYVSRRCNDPLQTKLFCTNGLVFRNRILEKTCS